MGGWGRNGWSMGGREGGKKGRSILWPHLTFPKPGQHKPKQGKSLTSVKRVNQTIQQRKERWNPPGALKPENGSLDFRTRYQDHSPERANPVPNARTHKKTEEKCIAAVLQHSNSRSKINGCWRKNSEGRWDVRPSWICSNSNERKTEIKDDS